MIEQELYGEVVVLRFARGRVNALDLELCRAITESLAELTDAGAVVLTGAGSCFSAGVDLKRLSGGGADYVQEFLPALTEAFLAVFDHPRPVVAAVNGHAIAGGCVVAAGCDRRLMSGGGIGLTELAVGVPFPVSALEIMRHVAGPVTDELILGHLVLDPDTALRKGLVDEVTEPADLMEKAIGQARALAEVPRATYRLTKQQLHRPARERIERYRPADDEAVDAIWRSGEGLGSVREYVENLTRK